MEAIKMYENLHITDILIIDCVKELHVLSRSVPPDFPRCVNFDNQTWYYFKEYSMTQVEASSYSGKAAYRLSAKSTDEEIPVLDSPAPQYFTVGAMYNHGTIDMLPTFLERGTWVNGYERTKPIYNDIFDKVKVGDRIAVKRLNGQGAQDMRILALGIVKDIDANGDTLYIKWIIQHHNRTVPLGGCIGTITGPLVASNWRDAIFSI
jgi:hypothetical protein